MSNRPELVNTKKAGSTNLDTPRVVNSNGKVILTVCLHACASTCLPLRAAVAACLSVIPGGVSSLFLFIN